MEEESHGELLCINFDVNAIYWTNNKLWKLEQLINDYLALINIYLTLKANNVIAFYICSGSLQYINDKHTALPTKWRDTTYISI